MMVSKKIEKSMQKMRAKAELKATDLQELKAVAATIGGYDPDPLVFYSDTNVRSASHTHYVTTVDSHTHTYAHGGTCSVGSVTIMPVEEKQLSPEEEAEQTYQSARYAIEGWIEFCQRIPGGRQIMERLWDEVLSEHFSHEFDHYRTSSKTDPAFLSIKDELPPEHYVDPGNMRSERYRGGNNGRCNV